MFKYLTEGVNDLDDIQVLEEAVKDYRESVSSKDVFNRHIAGEQKNIMTGTQGDYFKSNLEYKEIAAVIDYMENIFSFTFIAIDNSDYSGSPSYYFIAPGGVSYRLRGGYLLRPDEAGRYYRNGKVRDQIRELHLQAVADNMGKRY